MMSAVTTARLGREFDEFLYASVGDDDNGMPLTVLSALARMDVDPWEEASKLTQLPKSSAVTQLATLLGALRNAPVGALDPARIAAPLIALLPCRRDQSPAMLKAFAQGPPEKHPADVCTLFAVLTYVIFMMASQWLTESFQAPRQMQSPPTSTSPIVSPSVPTSSEVPQSAVK
jgi:hypothetical protein